MTAERGFPILALFVLEDAKMRLFLIGLSLLYVIGVSFARNVDFGSGPVSGDCAAATDIVFQTGSDRTLSDGQGATRITNEIIPNPEQTLIELLQQGGAELDEVIPTKIDGC